MANNTKHILSLLTQFSRMKDKATRIKNDEERRQKSCYFSITSIFTSILAALACIGGAWLFGWESPLILFTIILGIGLVICGVLLFIWSLIRLLFQFGINKNWSGWVALICLVACVIVSIYYISTILG